MSENVLRPSTEERKDELFTGDISDIPNQLNQSSFTDIKINQQQDLKLEELVCFTTKSNQAKEPGVKELGELFKKMLIYGSKIEELKHKLFDNNQEFNLLGIFDIYDENQDGNISLEELTRLMRDMGIDIKEDQIEIFLRCLQEKWGKSPSSVLKFAQFTKLFYPVSMMMNFNIFDKFYERTSDSQNLQIEQSDFDIMKEIIMLTFVKIKDMQELLAKLKVVDQGKLFEIVSNKKLEIFLSDIKSFLDLNSINFMEEDLLYIIEAFKTNNKSKISKLEFEALMNDKVWDCSFIN